MAEGKKLRVVSRTYKLFSGSLLTLTYRNYYFLNQKTPESVAPKKGISVFSHEFRILLSSKTAIPVEGINENLSESLRGMLNPRNRSVTPPFSVK